MLINKRVQDFYEVLEEQNAKTRTAVEIQRREMKVLPEAYVEAPVLEILKDEITDFEG